ncbi:hypothetical protein Trydic_g16996 [Trypoxylus dichotomus]
MIGDDGRIDDSPPNDDDEVDDEPPHGSTNEDAPMIRKERELCKVSYSRYIEPEHMTGANFKMLVHNLTVKKPVNGMPVDNLRTDGAPEWDIFHESIVRSP